MSHKFVAVLGLVLLLIAAALIAWDLDTPTPAAAQDGGEECEGAVCPDWIVEAWSGSGHADTEAEAFNHWNEEDPPEVPVTCAKCHSEGGYLDFLGVDGTAAGVVDNPAPIGTTVTCTACHNPGTVNKDSVVFPSGVEITGLDASARCMECHQGRESTVSVNEAIAATGLGPDESSPDLGFRNIHYFAAASSLYGSEVHGGYEFEGMAYQTKNEHVPGYDSCVGCHNVHTLELKVNECSVCHHNVTSAEDLHSIRMNGSMVDYDGDGSMDESIYDELEGMQALLYQAIQAYASEVAGTAIVYDGARYPYFFADDNANGEIDGEEGGYNAWTPRLLEAAYNFQAYEKDPGAFAHNAKYYAELLYDSMTTLNEQLGEPIDLSQVHRNPPGHFDGTAEAFRHWDAEGEVPGTCTKCHTSEGLPFYLDQGVTIAFEPSTSLACSTCHTNFEDFALFQSDEVTFPSGAVLSFGEGAPANLCINCHQGRESTVSVDNLIASAGVGDDEVSDALRFINVHYFAAGATLFGSEAEGIYQYAGKEYNGRFMHVPGVDTCVACHSAHALTVKVDTCATCHAGVEDPHDIRMSSGDYDGDGADEGVAGEIATMHEALLAAIQAYAADTIGTPIAYNTARYPYWFTDTNGDGVADADESVSDNGYASWTPTLLRAAYNYQYVAKDPGAFAHNGKYVVQVLYDTLEAIGGADAVAGMTRP
jgi:hypothetical protein